MPQHSQVVLEPRKSPVQARSTASVEALLEATIRVLLNVGKEKLTTTKVASRALVSVGTAEVARAVELVCKEQTGKTHRQIAAALVSTFLQAKMKDTKTSAALHSVSSDVDGAKIMPPAGLCRIRSGSPKSNGSARVFDAA